MKNLLLNTIIILSAVWVVSCANAPVKDVPPVDPAPTTEVEVNKIPDLDESDETRVEKKKNARFVFDLIFKGLKK